MATTPSDGAPAWVDDPSVPLSDDELQHYKPAIAPQVEGGNAMAVLATRAMNGMLRWMELLVDYARTTEEGAKVALDGMETINKVAVSQFIDGARWGFEQGQEGPNANFDPDVEMEAEAAWAARWGDVERQLDRDSERVRARRALLALAAHARMTVALAIILDRHSLAPDEMESVEAALKIQPHAEYEEGIARDSIDEFIAIMSGKGYTLADEDDLRGWDDLDCGQAREQVAAIVREGTEAALQLAADKHDSATRELLDGVIRGGSVEGDEAADLLRQYPGAVTLLPEPTVVDLPPLDEGARYDEGHPDSPGVRGDESRGVVGE